jgi:protein SCO1/2
MRNMMRPLSLIILGLLLTMCAATANAQGSARKRPQARNAARKAMTYACPMHPEVVSNSPGRCRKCGMDLRAISAKKEQQVAASVEMMATNATMTTTKSEVDKAPLRIPDTAVIDQNGRKLNFYTDLVKGKTVVINFIFTTCKTVCPPLTATFRKVQQGLGERAGRNVEMISISVDPTTDVPERLKEFSAKFKAGPGWTFVTGDSMDIGGLLKALGAAIPDDKSNHTSLILIGNDATGYWTRAYGLAPASTILKAIDEAEATGNNNRTASVTVPAPGEGKADASEMQKKLAQAASKYFPNTVLVNQDQKPMRFYDDLLKGKTVMINFMLTHCTGACSPMTANLVKVQKYLGDRVGKDVVMISISVDPEHDTPDALKKYADGFKIQPGWYFLTGTKADVQGVLSKLGGYTEDPQQHSTVLIIGDEATGQWMKVPALSRPSEIADAVAKILSAKKEPESVSSTER